MRYVVARITLECREMTYRFYISEGIRAIANNSAQTVGGIVLSKSYAELLKPQKEEKRTAKEVIDHIKQGLSK